MGWVISVGKVGKSTVDRDKMQAQAMSVRLNEPGLATGRTVREWEAQRLLQQVLASVMQTGGK